MKKAVAPDLHQEAQQLHWLYFNCHRFDRHLQRTTQTESRGLWVTVVSPVSFCESECPFVSEPGDTQKKINIFSVFPTLSWLWTHNAVVNVTVMLLFWSCRCTMRRPLSSSRAAAAAVLCRLRDRAYDIIRRGQPGLAEVFTSSLLLPLLGSQTAQESVSAETRRSFTLSVLSSSFPSHADSNQQWTDLFSVSCEY